MSSSSPNKAVQRALAEHASAKAATKAAEDVVTRRFQDLQDENKRLHAAVRSELVPPEELNALHPTEGDHSKITGRTLLHELRIAFGDATQEDLKVELQLTEMMHRYHTLRAAHYEKLAERVESGECIRIVQSGPRPC